ncbi:hypothetical protein NGC38_21885 [Kluyvera cryocrescens]|uniref:hypothetical protein n=1 Tax=Kluyvera cryocrescens TaxID=580 RepID=UPI002DBB2053|nr:hypothetical protein [Kluyvera cryocrescens]MEB7559165.1 hypothetical protein [Kluyvera cryocrescens]
MDTNLIAYETLLAAQETAKWTYWMMFATWFTGGATFAAVLVSLYLATHETKVRLKIKVDEKNLIIERADISAIQFGISFEITNLSTRPVTISHIGWRCGKGNYWIQKLGDAESDVLPKKIDYGERCFLWVEISEKRESWYSTIGKQLFGKRLNPEKLRLFISTTTTEPFYAKPSKQIINNLKSEIGKLSKIL